MNPPAKPDAFGVADAEWDGAIAYEWLASPDDVVGYGGQPMTHYGLVVESSAAMAADMANIGSYRALVTAVGDEHYRFILAGLTNGDEYWAIVTAVDMEVPYADRQWRDYVATDAKPVTPTNPFKVWVPPIHPEPTPLPLEYDIVSPNGSISLKVKRDVVMPTLDNPCQLAARLRLTVTEAIGIPKEVFVFQRYVQIIDQTGTIRDRFICVAKPSDLEVYPVTEPLEESDGPPFFRLAEVDLLIDSPSILLEADQSIYESLLILVTEIEALKRIGSDQ